MVDFYGKCKRIYMFFTIDVYTLKIPRHQITPPDCWSHFSLPFGILGTFQSSFSFSRILVYQPQVSLAFLLVGFFFQREISQSPRSQHHCRSSLFRCVPARRRVPLVSEPPGLVTEVCVFFDGSKIRDFAEVFLLGKFGFFCCTL